MNKSLPNLYLITDRHQIQGQYQLLEVIEELLQAGVKMIQLREKDLSAAHIYPLAKELRSLTHSYDSLLFINDRIDLALAVGADGIHLGNHSLPIHVARKIVGSKFLIGASTHSTNEIELACQQGADFATYGPVFYTPSKVAYGNPVGIQSLQNICNRASIPVYALGGVKEDNAKQTLMTGAHGIAVISALLSAQSPTQAYQNLASHIKDCKNNKFGHPLSLV